MLFYESSSCLHGRRQIFKGKYYASIFMHYKPADDRVWDTTKLNIEVSIYISIMMIMFIVNGDRDDCDTDNFSGCLPFSTLLLCSYCAY